MKIIKKGQTAILISVIKQARSEEIKENLEELIELAIAVDLHPICKLQQNLKKMDSGFLIGSGKRKELEEKIKEHKPHYVIFDHSLTGVQTRNLEKLLKVHVLDRTQLILEIFASRAKSHEGKLQVELAQLMDQMPRMVGAWLGSLSRQGGGLASKGPGEKALETDRRQAQNRIQNIKKKLEKVKKSRAKHRQTRIKKQVVSFALIGYTNSGKSTLLNKLTHFNTPVKDQAFMTLDPKTRKIFIPGLNQEAVLTDTVGFIRQLPTHLIAAFKATLEESASADVILHVVDSAHPNRKQHIKVVDDLIEEFEWNEKPLLYVFNKADLLSPEARFPIMPENKNKVWISARTGWNLPLLLEKMKERIQQSDTTMELFFSKAQEHEIYELSRTAQILERESHQKGTYCKIKIPANKTKIWTQYLLK